MSSNFATEQQLCEAFIHCLPNGWTSYNETGGFDILLVNDATGFQIGIEAKLSLNACVVDQVTKRYSHFADYGPDCLAVLVGKSQNYMPNICKRLGVTVLEIEQSWDRKPVIRPELPRVVDAQKVNLQRLWLGQDREWHDLAPSKRVSLPEFVPDVPAGCASPMVLSQWKIQAMKMCVLIQRRTFTSPATFREMDLSMSMWTSGRWLQKTGQRGVWEAGERFPANRFATEHPAIWEKIEATYSEWSKSIPVIARVEAET